MSPTRYQNNDYYSINNDYYSIVPDSVPIACQCVNESRTDI
jgi:hypothetical protein